MFNHAVITTDGLELDTKIRAGLAVPTFTHIRLGDGEYDGSEDLNAATEMQSVRQTFEISSIVKMDNKTVRLRVVADNSGITEGYFISEMGVFALDPDKGEILYSIALGVDGKMDYQPSETELAGATSTFDTFTSVSNVDTAQIVIGTGAAASALDLAEAEERIAALEEPEFDDSGSAGGITGFPEFLAKIKSKMNLFGFLRDFKAGMQFVLHAGQIVNNCLSDATNMPLSAAQGKVLMELYTKLNSDFQINNDYLSRIRFVLQRSNALDERAYILNPDTLQETGEYMQLGASESGLIYHKHNSDGTNSLIWQAATKNEFKTERIQSISFGYMGEDQNILYLNFSITSNIFYSVRFNIAANDKIRLYRVENNVYTQVWSL